MTSRSHSQAEEANEERCHQEHGDEDVDAGIHRDDGGVAAEHHEFSMREIDHAHHAEHHGQSGADEEEIGYRIGKLDREYSGEVHGRGPLRGKVQPGTRRGTRRSPVTRCRALAPFGTTHRLARISVRTGCCRPDWQPGHRPLAYPRAVSG